MRICYGSIRDPSARYNLYISNLSLLNDEIHILSYVLQKSAKLLVVKAEQVLTFMQNIEIMPR